MTNQTETTTTSESPSTSMPAGTNTLPGPTPTIRAKFMVSSVMRVANSLGNIEQEQVQMYAATTGSEENKQWAKWTPGGSLSITITNEAAFGRLLPGQYYFLDFIPTNVTGI